MIENIIWELDEIVNIYIIYIYIYIIYIYI